VRVDVFVTCLADTVFPSVGTATVKLLERLGQDVRFQPAATCCGQMHLNSGYRAEASGILRTFADAYRGRDSDAIVVPSGSCASALRHQAAHLGVSLEDCPPVYELSEFLVDLLGVTDVGATYEGRATFHTTCHSLRLLDVGDRPQRLLSQVRGLDLVELASADSCCGFGGTFAVKNAYVSSSMGADKATAVVATGAGTLISGDVSCLMHIGGFLKRQHRDLKVLHLAEVLAS
jgi:L-lactate dehydrogenase complex protein LldE